MQDLWIWIGTIGGGLVALDRGLAAVSNLGLWPSRWKRFDLARAKEIVEQEERDEALTLLAHERDALVALAGIAPELQALPAAVAEIRYQVTANGGGSMRDDVTAIRRRLDDGAQRFDRLEGRVDALEGKAS